MSGIGVQYVALAADARRSGCEVYARLAEGIAGDGDLKSIAQLARKGQPHANMLLAAVHFLLLRGAAHPLGDYYASLGGTAKPGDADPFPLFVDFVARHRAEIERLVCSRVTNTNEVGRSVWLQAGFRALAQDAQEPFHVIEIGPSAGLNMVWDSYGVRFLRDGSAAAELAPGSALVIEAELRGAAMPPLGPAPELGRRIGLELNPVDLEDAGDRDWLRALVWPDHKARLSRLDHAIALARAAGPPDIRRGDAVELLAQALADLPRDGTVCVYHTIALYQFARPMKAALDDILTVAGLRRPVWRLACEYDDGHYPLTLAQYRDGTRHTRRLALCQSHGGWLEWLA